MTNQAIIHQVDQAVALDGDPLANLADFLRLNVAGGDASAKTIRSYYTHIRLFVVWSHANGINPTTATDHHVALYRRFMAESKYTRSTIAVKLSALRRFFDAAIWRGMRADNPAAGVKAPPDRTAAADRIRQKFYSTDDLVAILAQVDTDTPAGLRDASMITLMFYHGLRISDVVGLDLMDYKPGASPPTLSIRSGKGGKDRTNILIHETITTVDAWLAARSVLDSIRLAYRPALFVSLSNRSMGQRLGDGGARKAFNKYTKAAGVYEPGRSLHGLRHGHATTAALAGVPILVLAAEMGHASTSTTEQYIAVAQSITNNPAKAIAERIAKGES